MQLAGLHHVTCVCSDAQQTLDFYRDRSGSRSSRRPSTSTTRTATTSTSATRSAARARCITFFEWPRAEPGRLGRGTLESIGLATPDVAEETELEDPGRPAPAALSRPRRRGLRDVVVIGNPDLYAGLFDDDAPLRSPSRSRRRR